MRRVTPAACASVLCAIGALTVLSACSEPAPDLPILGEVPAWTFESADGGKVGSETLRGAPYAVNFLFTSCPTMCPPLAEATARLQSRLDSWDAARSRAHIVSITVDPWTDTAEKLRAYGERFGRDPERWQLARAEYEAMETLVVKGFMQPLLRGDVGGLDDEAKREKLRRGATPLDTAHSVRFVLVDGRGRIRGLFDKTDKGLDALSDAMRRLAGSDD